MSTAASDTAGSHRAPPWGIIAVGAFVLLVLSTVLATRLTGYQPGGAALAPVVAMRELGFRDRENGRIDIFDWRSGETITHYDAGEGSFLRGVMRSLVRQRRIAGITRELPFSLSRHADGRLLISDAQTGETIDLGAFGPDNIAVFAALLPAPGAAESAVD